MYFLNIAYVSNIDDAFQQCYCVPSDVNMYTHVISVPSVIVSLCHIYIDVCNKISRVPLFAANKSFACSERAANGVMLANISHLYNRFLSAIVKHNFIYEFIYSYSNLQNYFVRNN